MAESKTEFRRKDIGIYKANKKVTGAVAQFKMAGNNECMFLELAKQTGDMDSSKPYDWDNTKITVKLGIPDITKMMAYFAGNDTEPLKLFHKNDKGSKTIEMVWQDQYKNFYLKVTAKEGEDLRSIAIPISLDEVQLLKVGFTKGLELILGW